MRMKAHMSDHVERNRHNMFSVATQTVTSHLNQMCRALEEQMSQKVDEIFISMQRDYLQALGGVQTNQADQLPKGEKVMRADINSLLLSVDEQFRSIVDGEIEELDTEEQDMAAEVDPLEETAINDDDENETAFESAYREDEESIRDDASTSETSRTRTYGSDFEMQNPESSDEDDEEEETIKEEVSYGDDKDDEMDEEL